MRVVIAGAGIGGLVAAMALARDGAEVSVLEAVEEPRPLGVGINLLPHAMAVLADLGLIDELLPLGVPTAELCFFNRHGQLIWREPRGLDAGYPVPQLSVHRGNLQMTLLRVAQERLGSDAIRTGMEVRAVESDAHGARVEVLDRRRGTVEHEHADLCLAADGIHSAIRRQWYPDEGLPHWSGNVLWRAVSQAPAYLTGRSMCMVGHLPHKFVAYPITPPGPDGLCTVNWIAELDRRAAGLAGREDWNRRGDLADFLPRFHDWTFDWLDVPALIRAADAVYEFPMVDRDPLPRWTFGRATLLGDAAHPMYPIGSNGASQAILDAAAIAGALREHASDVDAALVAYEEERRPKTAAIVMANRRHGPERVLDLAEARAPQGFADPAEVFAPGELEEISAQYKQLAGFARRS